MSNKNQRELFILCVFTIIILLLLFSYGIYHNTRAQVLNDSYHRIDNPNKNATNFTEIVDPDSSTGCPPCWIISDDDLTFMVGNLNKSLQAVEQGNSFSGNTTIGLSSK